MKKSNDSVCLNSRLSAQFEAILIANIFARFPTNFVRKHFCSLFGTKKKKNKKASFMTFKHSSRSKTDNNNSYLIGEKSKLTFLAVQWRPVMNHLGVDLDLMDKLHVIAQLLEVPDVTITNFTNDKVVLAPLGGCTGFEAATRVGRRAAPA